MGQKTEKLRRDSTKETKRFKNNVLDLLEDLRFQEASDKQQ